MNVSVYCLGQKESSRQIERFDESEYIHLEPYILRVDGKIVLKQDYGSIVGENIQIDRLFQGEPRRVAATLGMMALAVYIPGWLNYTGFQASLFSYGLMVGGSYLVNSILPPPELPNSLENAIITPSQNYTLSSQNNIARTSEAIPSLYGRHLIYPDMAMRPYSEYVNNDQYLNMLLSLGHGYVEVENIYIEDTPLSTYEVEWDIYRNNAPVEMVVNNIYTSSEVTGQELLPVDDEDHDWVGPFTVSGPGQPVNGIEIDLTLPYGLYFQNTSSGWNVWFYIEIRAIDDNGAPLFDGAWEPLASSCISDYSTEAINRSFYYDVPEGRYELRIKRIDEHEEPLVDLTIFQQLKGYISSNTRTYGNISLIAMKIKADENINDRNSRKINAVCVRWLPIYDWQQEIWLEPQPSRSITWAILDILKNKDYGAGLEDADIDMTGLKELHDIWESRGDTFDAIFDQQTTVWEALTSVCRVGRTMPICIMGKIYFWRDQPQYIHRSAFTPANIVKESVSIEYMMPDKDFPDAIDIEYFSEISWCWEHIRCQDETAKSIQTMKLFGCVDRTRAWREGMFHLNSIWKRRKRIKFKTELDCSFLSFGEMIAIAHDLLGGNVGTLDNIISGNTIRINGLALDNLTEIYIRSNTGNLLGPYEVASIQDNDITTVENLPEIEISTGEKPFVVGAFQSFIIQKIKPLGAGISEIEAVNVENTVYDYDAMTPPSVGSTIPEAPVTPITGAVKVEKFKAIKDVHAGPGDIVGIYHIASWAGIDAEVYEIHVMPEDQDSWVYWEKTAGTEIKIYQMGWEISMSGGFYELGEVGIRTTTIKNLRVRGVIGEVKGAWSHFYGPIKWMTVLNASGY